MGKVPVRLKEVVYTVSPFEVTILSGLIKDFPQKVHKNLSEKGWDISLFCIAPVAATVWYAENYRKKETMKSRF